MKRIPLNIAKCFTKYKLRFKISFKNRRLAGVSKSTSVLRAKGRRVLQRISVTIIVACCLAGCGPKLMRIQAVKKDRFNFGTGTARFKSKKEHAGKIVFSDRSANQLYKDPYGIGRLPVENILAPYFIINAEGEYLEVVRYNPELTGKPERPFTFFKNPRYHFKDDQSVEYVGWIQKDHIIKYDHAVRNVANGDFDMYILGLGKADNLLQLQKFISEDRVYTFQEPRLKVRNQKNFKVNQIVYLYKYSPDGKAALIGSRNSIDLRDTDDLAMGWVPSTILIPAGQGLAYMHERWNGDSVSVNSGKKPFILPDEVPSPLWFNLNIKKKTALDQKRSVAKAQLPVSVWDHSKNRLISIKGTDITAEIIEKIRQENKILNFHLIIDCSQSLRDMEVQMISSFQKLKSLAESRVPDNYTIQYAATSFGCGTSRHLPLTADFSEWVDFVYEIVRPDGDIADGGAHTDFQDLLEMSLPKNQPSFENNIVMIVGSKSLKGFDADYNAILTRLVGSSARVYFHQLENKPSQPYQNFILQAKQLLGDMATATAEHIKSYNVDYDLIKDESSFARLPSQPNLYLFDSPEKSSYQGGIAFPRINAALTPGEFDVMVDSIVKKSFEFNRLCEQSRSSFLAGEFFFLRSVPGTSLKRMLPGKNVDKIVKNNPYEVFYTQAAITDEEKVYGMPGYLLHREDFKVAIADYRNLVLGLTALLKKKDRKRVFKKYWKLARAINATAAPSDSKLSKKSTLADLTFRKTGLSVHNQVYHSLRLKDIKNKNQLPHKAYINLYRDQQSAIDYLEELLAQPQYPWLAGLHGSNFFFVPVSKTF